MSVSRFSQSSLQNGFEKFNSIWDGRTAIPSMEAISSVTLTSPLTFVEFNSIPSTYTHLQLRAMITTSFNNQVISMVINNDTTASYSYHSLRANGSAATAEGVANSSNFPIYGRVVGTHTAYRSVVILDILDYANTNKFKTIRSLAGGDFNTSGEVNFISASWRKNDAINSFFVGPFNTNITFSTNSVFSLYGVK